MSDNPKTPPSSLPALQAAATPVDDQLRRLREYVAAILALIIILGTVIVITISLSLSGDAARFDRVKEIINLILPLLTFVLGYYFNKASTEARAEKAESAAQAAVTSAQMAVQGQFAAEETAAEVLAELDQTAKEAEEFRDLVEDFDSAAGEMEGILEDFTSPAPAPGLLSAEEDESQQLKSRMVEQRKAILAWRAKANVALKK